MYGICGWTGTHAAGGAEVLLGDMVEAARKGRPQQEINLKLQSNSGQVAENTGLLVDDSNQRWISCAGHNDSRLEQVATHYDKHGVDLPRHLQGPFLLVVNDLQQDRLLLATDRLGVHSCYYAETAEGLVFSNVLAGLLKHPSVKAEIDPQAIYNYIFFHCIPSPLTIYRGIKKLRPGERLVYEKGQLTSSTYWTPCLDRQAAESQHGSEPDLLGTLETAVRDRINGRTPGAFLSGGLDSSTVAGMLARATPDKASTFTIGFDASGYDESEYARISAEHFSTDHHEYFVTPQDVCDALPLIAEHYDEPFGNSSVVPTYFCARLAKESGCDYLLAGDGGDELFAGNERYVRQKIFEHYYSVPTFVRGLAELPYQVLPFLKNIPLISKGHSYIRQARIPLPDRMQSYNFLHTIQDVPIFRQEFLDSISTSLPLDIWRERYNEPEQGSSLQRMLYLDWKFTLADNDLVKVNNMCSLAGVDVSYPMLDEKLLDLSLKIPDQVMLPGTNLRHYYKQAMQGFLSERTLNKSKHGFGLPFGVWMRDHRNLQEMAYESINRLKNRDYFEPRFLDEAVDMHKQGTAGYYGELIWILMMLEMWMSHHCDT